MHAFTSDQEMCQHILNNVPEIDECVNEHRGNGAATGLNLLQTKTFKTYVEKYPDAGNRPGYVGFVVNSAIDGELDVRHYIANADHALTDMPLAVNAKLLATMAAESEMVFAPWSAVPAPEAEQEPATEQEPVVEQQSTSEHGELESKQEPEPQVAPLATTTKTNNRQFRLISSNAWKECDPMQRLSLAVQTDSGPLFLTRSARRVPGPHAAAHAAAMSNYREVRLISPGNRESPEDPHERLLYLFALFVGSMQQCDFDVDITNTANWSSLAMRCLRNEMTRLIPGESDRRPIRDACDMLHETRNDFLCPTFVWLKYALVETQVYSKVLDYLENLHLPINQIRLVRELQRDMREVIFRVLLLCNYVNACRADDGSKAIMSVAELLTTDDKPIQDKILVSADLTHFIDLLKRTTRAMQIGVNDYKASSTLESKLRAKIEAYKNQKKTKDSVETQKKICDNLLLGNIVDLQMHINLLNFISGKPALCVLYEDYQDGLKNVEWCKSRVYQEKTRLQEMEDRLTLSKADGEISQSDISTLETSISGAKESLEECETFLETAKTKMRQKEVSVTSFETVKIAEYLGKDTREKMLNELLDRTMNGWDEFVTLMNEYVPSEMEKKFVTVSKKIQNTRQEQLFNERYCTALTKMHQMLLRTYDKYTTALQQHKSTVDCIKKLENIRRGVESTITKDEHGKHIENVVQHRLRKAKLVAYLSKTCKGLPQIGQETIDALYSHKRMFQNINNQISAFMEFDTVTQFEYVFNRLFETIKDVESVLEENQLPIELRTARKFSIVTQKVDELKDIIESLQTSFGEMFHRLCTARVITKGWLPRQATAGHLAISIPKATTGSAELPLLRLSHPVYDVSTSTSGSFATYDTVSRVWTVCPTL